MGWQAADARIHRETEMARPREFDETAVLEAAVQCFWTRGYEATSIRDLADRMGIAGASLYNAFGDKRSLYRRALDHYVANSVAERIGLLEGHCPPREAIGAFLDEIVERSLSDPERKGCMLINSALELAPHDAAFQGAVADVLGQIEAFFRRCVAAGQASGTITSAQSADALAALLLSVLVGIRVLARAKPERDLLQGLARAALAMLDPRSP
jgi:TetR/AcrR family transcriptional regulator, transcriptional repressor for nem operon